MFVNKSRILIKGWKRIIIFHLWIFLNWLRLFGQYPPQDKIPPDKIPPFQYPPRWYQVTPLESAAIAHQCKASPSVETFNSSTLKSSSRNIVCYFHTFVNNLGTKLTFTKCLKESCCMASDQHFYFKYFQENTYLSNIFSKLPGLSWPLWALMG